MFHQCLRTCRMKVIPSFTSLTSYDLQPGYLARRLLSSQFSSTNLPLSKCGTNIRPGIVGKRCFSSNQEDPNNKRQALLYATYVSFGVGGCLMMAIIAREINKARLRMRGVSEVKDKVWIRVKLYKYKDYSVPDFYIKVLDDVENFEVKDDDVWVVSFPRSGTTWLQEIVYLIHSDLNFTGAKTRFLDDRFPYLEFINPGPKQISKLPSPRLIKTHLPMELLPKQVADKRPKIIYICRNPKDVAVSYFYFLRMLKPITRYSGKFEDFFQLFLHDKVPYTPWSRHVLQFWEQRENENILFLTYEGLKQDTEVVIRQIAVFLGKTLTDTDVKMIKEFCKFERMKNNSMSNYSWFKTLGLVDKDEEEFLRKGTIGDWRNHLTPEMDREIETMVARKLGSSGLNFEYGDNQESQTENAELISEIK